MSVDHVAVAVGDLARARRFYSTVLTPLGYAETRPWREGGVEVAFGPAGRRATFAITTALGGEGGGAHVAFAAGDRGQVDAFHAAALAVGGRSLSAPAPRPEYSASAYGAFVLDLDGNTVEAVCHEQALAAGAPPEPSRAPAAGTPVGAGVLATGDGADHRRLMVVIEIPKGSRNKYEYNAALGGYEFDRGLMSAAAYPTDYGYFPETLGEDGDALDALVCLSQPTFPGCLIAVKPVGLFKMDDEAGFDDKIICVPVHDPNWRDYERLEELPQLLRDEIEQFFSMYKVLEHKTVHLGGWFPREDAIRVIEEARARFHRAHADGARAYPGPGGQVLVIEERD
jgi:inorganic pyrophosphatase